MMEFNFSKYNNKTTWIRFFDAYIEAQGDFKSEVFNKLDISKSTFFRAMKKNIVSEDIIISKLSKYYKISIENSNLIKEIEELSNNIFNNAYYMNFDSFREDVKALDKKINKNGILTPILKLFKLFLILCKHNNAIVTDIEFIELYEEVNKYKKYFDKNLQNILDVVSLYMNDTHMINNVDLINNNINNPLYLQILATKCAINGKFVDALYYAEEAKNIFAKEMNFRRLIVVNKTRIYSLLCIKNYQKAYDISKYQRLSVKTFSKDINDIELANGYYYISMLGLKMYDRIIEMIYSLDSLNIYEYICYLVSLYKIDFNLYKDNINHDISNYIISTNDKIIIDNITEYINTKDKTVINRLKDMNFNVPLLMILEDL